MHQVVNSFFPTEQVEERGHITRLQQVRSFSTGETLLSSGEDAEGLHLVLEGCFAVHKPIGLGKRSQVVALLEAGTVIGEGVLAGGRPYSSTIVATEESVVATFSRAALAEIETIAPQLFITFIKKVFSITSIRLQKSSDRLALVL